MKYFLILFSVINQARACWFYSKQRTLDKIKDALERAHIEKLTKSSISAATKTLPAPVTWAIESIGVDAAFRDCDENQDGILTLQEMADSQTCLTSCAKLAIVNSVL